LLLFWTFGCVSEATPVVDCATRMETACVEPECFAEYGESCDGGTDVFACADGSRPCDALGVSCQPIGGGTCVVWLAGCGFQEGDRSCPLGWEGCEGSDYVSCPPE
jgi:hypothetical protein